ncbi:MAG TPA: glycosyltransferase family 39 protein [Bryobacteraceae bacterium]|jgi:hypothetical protein
MVRSMRDVVKTLWPAYLLASLFILWGLTWSLPSHRFIDKSFHADENAAVWAVNQIHPPGFNPHWFNWGTALFYQVYFLKLLGRAGGLLQVSDSGILLMGRLVVWISALGAITCVFLLCRQLFDVQTGRLASILLSVMPGFVINAHYFKTDIPMTFWLLAAFVVGYRLIATGNVRYVYLLGLLAGYSTSNKYSAAAVVPAGLIFLGMRNRIGSKLRDCLRYASCTAIGFLAGTPRVLPDPREFLSALNVVAEAGRSGSPAAIVHQPAWLDYLSRISQLSMTFPLWIAAAIGLGWLIVRKGKALLPVWVFLLGYTFVLAADNSRLMRYTVPLLPFAAISIAFLSQEIKRTGVVGRWLSIATVSLGIAYSLLFTISYVRVMTLEDPRVQAGSWISEHASRDTPFPVSTSHSLGAPQIQLWGYTKVDIETDVAKLREAASPYLALSEYVSQRYEGALDRNPSVQEFFSYLGNNYVEVARFENSQRLLGVDSKSGLQITHDWLYPNPRITIYQRRPSAVLLRPAF